MTRCAWHACVVLALVLGSAGCEREQRRYDTPPAVAPDRMGTAASSVLHGEPAASAIPATVATTAPDGYEARAADVAEGKRLYRWYNCNGCHAAGGGAIGPALMDDTWIYGHEPGQIVATILQGRPNGMPSFAGRIPLDQAWKLAAYVRSMSGQLAQDVAPGRSDSLHPGPAEQTRDPGR